MELQEKILVNIVFVLLLIASYLLFPVILITLFAVDGVLMTYECLIALLQSAFSATLSKCIHWVILPAVLLGLTTICWIKSRRIDISSSISLYWTNFRVKLDAIWTTMTEYGVLPFESSKAWELVKNYHMSFARVVVEDSVEEPSTIDAAARVRTKEEDRLHRFVNALEALEAEGLPEDISTEQAIILLLIRTAAANGNGIVCYRLYEAFGIQGPTQLPDLHIHQIMQPHPHYYKLHMSKINIFRPDEPDCAICYCPLEVGEAMVTHETCRRTFHTTCFNVALLGERMCPFDREKLVARPGEQGQTPIVDPMMPTEAEQQHVGVQPEPEPLEENEGFVWAQDEDRQPILPGMRDILRWFDEQVVNDAPRIVRGAALQMPEGIAPLHQAPPDRAPRNQAPRQERRPANNRPYHNNARGRWMPRRAWR